MFRTLLAVVVAVAAGVALYGFLGRGEPALQPVSTTTPATTTAATTTMATSSVQAMVVNIARVASTTTDVIKDIATPPESGWKKGTATVFWVGEGETEDNGYITNVEAAWDDNWMEHFGGLDDPDERCGFEPCDFTPKENPFYVALPYNDLDDNGDQKADAKRIPRYQVSEETLLKNRWVEVRVNGKTCFGQWQDVGPFHEDDIEYVFGTALVPLNQEGMKAGIDLSPALRDCLSVGDVSTVQWRHADGDRIPAGPWKKTITTRGMHW